MKNNQHTMLAQTGLPNATPTTIDFAPSCPAGGEFKSINLAPNPAVPSYINRFSGSVSFYNNSQLGVTRLTKSGGGFPGRETFTFSASFELVTKVEWVQDGPAFHQFDTIVVMAIR